MSKAVKESLTGELTSALKDVSSLVVINTQALDGKSDNALRRALRLKKIRIRSVKNTLARKVLGGRGFKGVESLFTGPSAVAVGAADVEIKEIAGELVEAAKKYPALQVKGGIVEGTAVDAEGVKAVASGPGRREYIAKVMALVMGPGTRLASLIAGPSSEILGLVKDVADKKGTAEAAPAPAAG